MQTAERDKGEAAEVTGATSFWLRDRRLLAVTRVLAQVPITNVGPYVVSGEGDGELSDVERDINVGDVTVMIVGFRSC